MISYAFCYSKNSTLTPILSFLKNLLRIVIGITFCSPSCLGQETAKGPFSLPSQAVTCLPHTAEASHCPFNCWTSSKEAVNTNFYSLWFDPAGNRTRVYRFSSKRSIHSTTDRFTKTKAKIQRNYSGLLLSYTSN